MIYVFLADGFEETEALAPVDMLRRAGVAVKTVGIGTGTPCSSHGIVVQTDIGESDVRAEDLQGILLPGGMPGTVHLEQSPLVQKMIDYAGDHQKIIAAICAAPSILGHKGLLEGRRYTCYPGFETAAGYTGAPAEQDGCIITGKGAGAVFAFGARLVAALTDQETAERVLASIQYSR